MTEFSGHIATCALCHNEFPVELILGHLRGEHDIEGEPATWPDGELVIIDDSLEPDDFNQGPSPA